MIDATLVDYFSREKWPNMSAGKLGSSILLYAKNVVLSKNQAVTDLTTALSGLSQAEIAKIKSVLDRDQESWDSISKSRIELAVDCPSFWDSIDWKGVCGGAISSRRNPEIRLDL